MRKSLLIAYCLTALWMLVIFLLSNEPAEVSSGRSAVLVDVVRSVIATSWSGDIWTFLVRKSAHILAYFVLGILCINVLRYYALRLWQMALVAISISFTYALTDEWHQMFVPGRSGELRDVLIDTIAACAGVGCAVIIRHYLHYRRRKLVV